MRWPLFMRRIVACATVGCQAPAEPAGRGEHRASLIVDRDCEEEGVTAQDMDLDSALAAVPGDQVRLLTKVARMYHERGMRQPEIAAQLRLSQPRVSRLL